MNKAEKCLILHAYRPLKIGKILQTTKSNQRRSEKGHTMGSFLLQNRPKAPAIIQVFYFLPRYI